VGFVSLFSFLLASGFQSSLSTERKVQRKKSPGRPLTSLGKSSSVARPPFPAWQLLNWRVYATAFRLFTQSEVVAIFLVCRICLTPCNHDVSAFGEGKNQAPATLSASLPFRGRVPV
jgi:hypothetical protein